MNNLPFIFVASIASFFVHQQHDPCEDAKAGAARATLLAKDSIYISGLNHIKNAFKSDLKEHAIAFGKDANNNIFSSGITNGSTTGGTIPGITNAFADLHNHPNNTPPDAGDFYGLIDISKNKIGYDTRFVVTPSGTVYALLVTDPVAAVAFNIKHPRQAPAFAGGPPGFPVNMVDEFREIKYQNNCTDEMVLAFILEKYHAGISLLKQDSSGAFKKLMTIVSADGDHLIFTANNCP